MADKLSKYPNLKRYFKHFAKNEGEPELNGFLPNLIVWIRLLVEPENGEWTDPVAFFGLTGDEAEDFFSWGSNSRWKNVFWPFAIENLDLVKEKCMELAELHGDPSVEEYREKAGRK